MAAAPSHPPPKLPPWQQGMVEVDVLAELGGQVLLLLREGAYQVVQRRPVELGQYGEFRRPHMTPPLLHPRDGGLVQTQHLGRLLLGYPSPQTGAP